MIALKIGYCIDSQIFIMHLLILIHTALIVDMKLLPLSLGFLVAPELLDFP